MENLDLKCAEYGKRIADLKGIEEKSLTNALSVLEEQGLYACFLYLKAREGNLGEQISQQCAELLQSTLSGSDSSGDGALSRASRLAETLDDLLFARDLVRQTLVYARYHIKAKAGAKT